MIRLKSGYGWVEGLSKASQDSAISPVWIAGNSGTGWGGAGDGV